MKERNDEERLRLDARKYVLETQRGGGVLPPELEAELALIRAKLEKDPAGNYKVPVVDPFYGGDRVKYTEIFGNDNPGVREIVAIITKQQPVGDHQDGVLPIEESDPNDLGPLSAAEKALAAVYGLMEADNLTDPDLNGFVGSVSVALGEYTASQPLFDKVLEILVLEAMPTGNGTFVTVSKVDCKVVTSEIRADEWAQVVRILRLERVSVTDPYLRLKTRNALARVEGAGEEAPPASISIDLPDLEAQSDVRIQADNIRAMQAIFFAATLEDMKMFQVVDKLVEQFQSGVLPLGRGNAGNLLYAYWKKSINRFTEIERRNLYARTLGFPGGEAAQATINRDFDDLFLRFVSAVNTYVRQFQLDDLLRSRAPGSVSQEQVRKSGRDLAANLSLHGYGIAYFAATDLQAQIEDIIGLLSDPEIKAAYGARDIWQVIDQVATLELGGAKSCSQLQALAKNGSIVIRWLAERANLLSSSNLVQVIDVNAIRNYSVRPKGVKPTVDPTDRDLIDACDQWLAVTGTREKSIEEYAQPTVGPNQTSRPIQIPRVAQDMLASVGIKPNGNILS
jgi:hypothetical protein